MNLSDKKITAVNRLQSVQKSFWRQLDVTIWMLSNAENEMNNVDIIFITIVQALIRPNREFKLLFITALNFKDESNDLLSDLTKDPQSFTFVIASVIPAFIHSIHLNRFFSISNSFTTVVFVWRKTHCACFTILSLFIGMIYVYNYRICNRLL